MVAEKPGTRITDPFFSREEDNSSFNSGDDAIKCT
jgi:hypothetical protein